MIRMANTSLGARGIAAEAAIARLCLEGLPALELFEQIAIPFRRAVPYSAACWKPIDPHTLLFTGFGIEDPESGALAAARWRFVDNELLEPDYAKFRELTRRRVPVSTLHRETHGEPGRSARYRRIHSEMGFAAELRAVFRVGNACWGSVAVVRGEGESDFSEQEIAFVSAVGSHIGHALRDALLSESNGATAGQGPGVIVLDGDGGVRSLTEQAKRWLEQIPLDRGTGLSLPAVIHAVARRAATRSSSPAPSPHANLRLASGHWLTVGAAALESAADDGNLIAVTLAPVAIAEREKIQLELYELTPREREVALLLTRAATNDEIARALWISRHTVKDHVKAIYAKVGVASRAELGARLFHESIAPHLESERVREFAAPT
jgi:DNA-binding CsgD family transcriptional regulator/GAF domain-containing protein